MNDEGSVFLFFHRIPDVLNLKNVDEARYGFID